LSGDPTKMALTILSVVFTAVGGDLASIKLAPTSGRASMDIEKRSTANEAGSVCDPGDGRPQSAVPAIGRP
jgi:hypothetical protein